MKRVLLITLSLLLVVVVAQADSDLKKDPLLHPRRAKQAGTPKMPKPLGSTKGSDVALPATTTQRSAKAGTVDSQIKSLEQQNARMAATEASKSKQRSAAAFVPKTQNTPSGNKPIVFGYAGGKVHPVDNTAAQGSATTGRGVRRRVKPGR